eukprot:scaffold156592_cov21-Tisochrysis_lutea.AAC.1
MFAGKLAAASIRNLHRKNAEGLRPIDELYAACCSAADHPGGQRPTASVQEKYFAVFSQPTANPNRCAGPGVLHGQFCPRLRRGGVRGQPAHSARPCGCELVGWRSGQRGG